MHADRCSHVRISFLPKRPERSLEIERPMIGVKNNVKCKENGEGVESKTASLSEVVGGRT